MLLAVSVLPLGKSLGRAFRHPADGKLRIEELVLELEDAYRDCYLSDAERKSFVIEKVQDGDGFDLPASLTLERVFSDPSQAPTIRVVRRDLGQGAPDLPLSGLRVSRRKRADDLDEHSDEHRDKRHKPDTTSGILIDKNDDIRSQSVTGIDDGNARNGRVVQDTPAPPEKNQHGNLSESREPSSSQADTPRANPPKFLGVTINTRSDNNMQTRPRKAANVTQRDQRQASPEMNEDSSPAQSSSESDSKSDSESSKDEESSSEEGSHAATSSDDSSEDEEESPGLKQREADFKAAISARISPRKPEKHKPTPADRTTRAKVVGANVQSSPSPLRPQRMAGRNTKDTSITTVFSKASNQAATSGPTTATRGSTTKRRSFGQPDPKSALTSEGEVASDPIDEPEMSLTAAERVKSRRALSSKKPNYSVVAPLDVDNFSVDTSEDEPEQVENSKEGPNNKAPLGQNQKGKSTNESKASNGGTSGWSSVELPANYRPSTAWTTADDKKLIWAKRQKGVGAWKYIREANLLSRDASGTAPRKRYNTLESMYRGSPPKSHKKAASPPPVASRVGATKSAASAKPPAAASPSTATSEAAPAQESSSPVPRRRKDDSVEPVDMYTSSTLNGQATSATRQAPQAKMTQSSESSSSSSDDEDEDSESAEEEAAQPARPVNTSSGGSGSKGWRSTFSRLFTSQPPPAPDWCGTVEGG
ncbi:MAG: hypothetical protein M1828_000009 [Chrysothrix sp. TS-e1954]|nr:MAG: hypothetical protein M1828_000009 [Chrysothrix sp. TS-e1954]